MKRLITVVLISLLGLSVMIAQSEWKVDKVHSSVTFTVSHMVISEVTGSFKDYSITISASKDDFSDAKVESIIKVASISTDNSARDNHLKSDDFFNAEKYPEITLKNAAFQKIDGNKYKITGDLTIRDVTKQVTFDAVLNGTIKTKNGLLSAWKATAVINRFDFNLKWSEVLETGGLMVGNEVTIKLNLELKK
jgi:polyisoprenoid-binding protein YceI